MALEKPRGRSAMAMPTGQILPLIFLGLGPITGGLLFPHRLIIEKISGAFLLSRGDRSPNPGVSVSGPEEGGRQHSGPGPGQDQGRDRQGEKAGLPGPCPGRGGRGWQIGQCQDKRRGRRQACHGPGTGQEVRVVNPGHSAQERHGKGHVTPEQGQKCASGRAWPVAIW